MAHRLDELGIDLIEGGFPSSNPKELELFDLLSRERFGHAAVAAFGMTRRRDVSASEDPALRVLADCFAPVCTLVGKTWALHLEKVVKVDREENLRMISESIAFLVGVGKRVVYDAEHFFDGFHDDRDYALQCLRVAAEAGAETVVCCDTNGGTLPDRVAGGDGGRRRRAHRDRGPRRNPLPQRCGLRCREFARRRAGGRGARPGDDEWVRRALRKREPRHDHPEPPAQTRLRLSSPTRSSAR